MLIYAFRDADDGTWYGDPDAAIHALQPRRGTLTLPLTAPGRDPGVFDGRQVEVLYAACEAEPSQTTYRLDNGDTVLATWQVHELLAPAYRPGFPKPTASPEAAATAAAPEASPASASARASDTSTVRLEIGSPHRRYNLHADLLPEGRTAISVVVCTPDGVILGELAGEVDASDLGEISRLLAAAPVAPAPAPAPFHPALAGAAHSAPAGSASASAPRVPGVSAEKAAPPVDGPQTDAKATRHGQAWTTEAVAQLKDRYQAGKTPGRLAQELGRSEKSIRWKLYALELAPHPADAVQAPRPPAEPEVVKAYTVDEKRRLHPNAYKPWEPGDELRLAERCAQGASLSELSREFGRNEGAIASRLLKIEAKGPAVEEAYEYGG
ncbi:MULTISPECIES: hypothetical protein [Streptomyces]|uniref:Uncharacterized protein n=1 Tax=Streptomyces viridochromogenes TaxID=1938 RepID=A0A0L8LC15_STRVR|nr:MULTISPECIES: hypothetical protein [Streptomyces]KOG35654.1 hypothetical protein ADK34_04880 [Streptomyces viridochromogenes]